LEPFAVEGYKYKIRLSSPSPIQCPLPGVWEKTNFKKIGSFISEISASIANFKGFILRFKVFLASLKKI